MSNYYAMSELMYGPECGVIMLSVCWSGSRTGRKPRAPEVCPNKVIIGVMVLFCLFGLV